MYVIESGSRETPYLPDLCLYGPAETFDAYPRHLQSVTAAGLLTATPRMSHGAVQELRQHIEDRPRRIPAHLSSTFIHLSDLATRFAANGGGFDRIRLKRSGLLDEVVEAGHWINRRIIWVSIDDLEGFPDGGILKPWIMPRSEVAHICGAESHRAQTTAQFGSEINVCAMQYTVDRQQPTQPLLLSEAPRIVVGTSSGPGGFSPFRVLVDN